MKIIFILKKNVFLKIFNRSDKIIITYSYRMNIFLYFNTKYNSNSTYR